MPQRYLKKILDARVYDVAIESPLTPAPMMSRRLHNAVFLKREDLQPVFSFKLRGAYNKMVQLPDRAKERGVIAASAGNHAQGVALAAAKLGIRAVIVMPRTTPEIKVNLVRARDAQVILKGDTFDEAARHAARLKEEKGFTYIPPYDDEEVIAGQGTIAMELVRQFSGRFDAVFVPVGGGGLIAGMAVYLKYLRPEVKVIGVEPEDSACLHAALKAGRRVALKEVGLFAEGVAVGQVGRHPWQICRNRVDESITVTADEICAAIKDVFEDTRSIAEPAGALALAGLKKYAVREKVRDQSLIAVVSGANVNFDRLRYVSERTEIGEKREVVLAVSIPEQPGSFREFIGTLGKRSITEFNYRYADRQEARVFVGVQVPEGGEERVALVGDLRAKGYGVTDLTDNDLAKQHIRHMVGGHAPEVADEHVFQFEFPERPGALLTFLMSLGSRWTISLFHYRNHGSAYSRVLLGAQVPGSQLPAFNKMLDRIGFRRHEVTDDPAYRLFLGMSHDEY